MNEKESIDIILEKSKVIQDVLNNELITQFAKLHNIPDNYNKFYMKQEIVAKRGYFLDVKKKYALWIVNKEGVPVNEYEIKGLVTRRSDYPRLTKERLVTIFDLLLKHDKISFKKISEYIKETEFEIRDRIANGDKSIAKPVSYSKDIAQYKKLPEQIIGMELWNTLEYKHFVVGTKGYRFKIKGVDTYTAPEKIKRKLNKIKDVKWIVLPYDEEKLPDYYVIDIDAMLEFAWTKRVDELLKPIISRVSKREKFKNKKLTTF